MRSVSITFLGGSLGGNDIDEYIHQNLEAKFQRNQNVTAKLEPRRMAARKTPDGHLEFQVAIPVPLEERRRDVARWHKLVRRGVISLEEYEVPRTSAMLSTISQRHTQN